jgi:hypothetical protein
MKAGSGMNGIDGSFTTKLYLNDAIDVTMIVWILFDTDYVPVLID